MLNPFARLGQKKQSEGGKNRALLIQGNIIVQRKKRREKWTPEFYPKGVLDKQGTQILFCKNGIQKVFCIGCRKWKTLKEEIKLPTIKQQ